MVSLRTLEILKIQAPPSEEAALHAASHRAKAELKEGREKSIPLHLEEPLHPGKSHQNLCKIYRISAGLPADGRRLSRPLGPRERVPGIKSQRKREAAIPQIF